MVVGPNYFGTRFRSWGMGAHLKSYCGSIKHISVNFNSREKQGQFYSGITLSIQPFFLQTSFYLIHFPSDRVFFTGTSYQTLQNFLLNVSSGLYCDQQWRRHPLINLKTFAFN